MSISTTSTTDAANAASSAGTSSSSSTSGSGSSALGESQFLQLLTAQLANQDPTSPMDDSTFVAELAQFSSVEQLTSVNSNLQSLLVAQASNNQTNTASLIGKDVLYNSSSVTLGATGGANMYANLSGPAASVTAVITNSSGQTVRTIQAGAEPGGQVTIPWDGKNDQGQTLPAGNYTVSITATDSSGNAVTVNQEEQGLVTGVNYANGYPELVVNGNDVQMSSVDEIDSPAVLASLASQPPVLDTGS